MPLRFKKGCGSCSKKTTRSPDTNLEASWPFPSKTTESPVSTPYQRVSFGATCNHTAGISTTVVVCLFTTPVPPQCGQEGPFTVANPMPSHAVQSTTYPYEVSVVRVFATHVIHLPSLSVALVTLLSLSSLNSPTPSARGTKIRLNVFNFLRRSFIHFWNGKRARYNVWSYLPSLAWYS